jgi:hypothetical protein
MGLFFLVPLGAAALGHGKKTVWLAAVLAILGNTLATLLPVGGAAGDWTDVLYFGVIAVLCAWIVAPPLLTLVDAGGSRSPVPAPDLPYRVVIASLFGAVVMGLLLSRAGEDTALYALVRSQAEFFSGLYSAAQGANVVDREVLEHYLTPEAVMNLIMGITLRGGAQVSCALIFMVGIQGAALVHFVTRRIRLALNLADFHVRPGIIWVLSLSLAGIVVSRKFGLELVEIAAWNGLTACALLYLAQGIGIVSFFFARRALPVGVRMAVTILLVVMIFSPVFNAILVGVVVVLGIVENWAPLRAPRVDGPSSTPGNGD